ncbi:hypothetical protein QQ045_000480 [Rhodiola kirilowii]
MLSFKQAMKLLEDIEDPESRLKIMEKLNTQLDIASKTSKSQEVHREIVNPKPYLMNKVYRRIIQKIENKRLDQRISRIEKRKEVITSHQDFEWSRLERHSRRINTYKVFS